MFDGCRRPKPGMSNVNIHRLVPPFPTQNRVQSDKNVKLHQNKTKYVMDASTSHQSPKTSSAQVNLRPNTRKTRHPLSEATTSPPHVSRKPKTFKQTNFAQMTRYYLYKYRKSKSPCESWIVSSCRRRGQQFSCLLPSSLGLSRRAPFRLWLASFRLWEAF